jgi:electron transport complex protein RnfG
MKDIFRFASILTLVSIISAGSLAWINEITKPKILTQQEDELNRGLYSVLPGSADGIIAPVKKNDTTQYYIGYKDKDRKQLIGYAFTVESTGYSSKIQTLVGVDSTYTIYSIRVLYQQETPGLGTRIEEIKSGGTTPWWQDQFSGKYAVGVAVDKDNGEIEAITGATITSRAVANGISQRAEEIRQKIRNP